MSSAREEGRSGVTPVMRAVLGGALLAALLETLLVLASSGPSFDGLGERLTFLGLELMLFAGLVGPLAAAALLGWLALRGRSDEARARVAAVLASPACAYIGWAAFQGPRARALSLRPVLIALVALVGVATIFVAVKGAGAIARRLTSPRAVGLRRGAVAALVLLACVLHLVDQRVLPRLYPFFHRGLELVWIVVCVAAVAAYCAARPVVGRAGVAVAVAATMALIGAGAARAGLAHERALTTILLDRAPAGAQLARFLLRSRAASSPATGPVIATAPVEAALPPGPRLGSRDVILVTIDALRADRLTAAIMPTATGLAERGVRFTEAYTQVPHTSFAVATLLTGKHVYSLSALGLDAASHETLAGIMRRERYKTAAFFPPAVFFIDRERLAPLEKSAYGFEYVKYEYLDATRRTDQIIDFFEREKPARAFVWVHYLEPHEPYEVHPGYTAGSTGGPKPTPGRSEAELRYEGEARYVDAELARLFAFLRRTRPGALIVLAADHGEEFGEHGGRYHGTTLFDEQVRVPLVFALLDGSEGLPAREVGGAVGLVDVAPTVLALLGVPASAKVRGRDLSPFMAAAPLSGHARPAFAEIDRKKMVVDGAHKLACDLELGTCALYDRARDPGERRDVSAEQPEVAARLRGLLDGFMRGEARFEEREAMAPQLRAVFERARLGDGQAVPELIAQFPAEPARLRREALSLLASLPPMADPRLATLPAEGEEELSLRDLVQARAGDEKARARLTASLEAPGPAPAWRSDELYARLALGSRSVPAMARAIETIDDRDLVVALADALAASGDARALDSLIIGLSPVRSREGVARAIGVLGDARAVVPLSRWLPWEPYVPARAAMVGALAAIAERAPAERAAVRAALSERLAVEQEAPVLRALGAALGPGRVGASEIVRGQLPRSAAGQERLLVLDDPAMANQLGMPAIDGMVRLPASVDRLSAPAFVVIRRPIPAPILDEQR